MKHALAARRVARVLVAVHAAPRAHLHVPEGTRCERCMHIASSGLRMSARKGAVAQEEPRLQHPKPSFTRTQPQLRTQHACVPTSWRCMCKTGRAWGHAQACTIFSLLMPLSHGATDCDSQLASGFCHAVHALLHAVAARQQQGWGGGAALSSRRVGREA